MPNPSKSTYDEMHRKMAERWRRVEEEGPTLTPEQQQANKELDERLAKRAIQKRDEELKARK